MHGVSSLSNTADNNPYGGIGYNSRNASMKDNNMGFGKDSTNSYSAASSNYDDYNGSILQKIKKKEEKIDEKIQEAPKTKAVE
jgi:hypothetical protein